MAGNVVANVMDQFRADLEPHILRNISEVSEDKCHRSSGFRVGSDASVIELNWHGTCCVGKVLRSIFFQDSEPSGMQHILTKFCKEINLLKELKHPNIVQFLGLYYRQSSPIPIMVMEKMECNLTELLDTYKIGSIPEYKAYGILNDVMKGLVYLHEVKEVAHRDLSSNNILVTSYLCAKIADLGSARVLNKPGGWNMTIQPGIDFMPPEALEDPPRYGLSVDVFSFGCVIIHLITHQWPRPVGQTSTGNIISEFERRRKFIEKMGHDHPLFSVVERCVQNDVSSRPSSNQVLELLGSIADKQQLERTHLQDFITGLQCRRNQQIDEHEKELIKKDAAIKDLQESEHIKEITQVNEQLRDKVSKLSYQCETAELEWAIFKSANLEMHDELQKYKEKVISLEHDIRKGKQVEADLYKELDEALKDLETISIRYRSLQKRNKKLKQDQSKAVFSGNNESQYLNLNSKQLVDNEKMLTKDYQQHFQAMQPLLSGYKQYDNTNTTNYLPNTHPLDDSYSPTYFVSPIATKEGISDPCPICGKRFSTYEELIMHAACCNL